MQYSLFLHYLVGKTLSPKSWECVKSYLAKNLFCLKESDMGKACHVEVKSWFEDAFP